jgi:hypothetical protein
LNAASSRLSEKNALTMTASAGHTPSALLAVTSPNRMLFGA